MTDLQLYSEISSLPSDLKQEVSDFIAFLKQKSKNNSSTKSKESIIVNKTKLSEFLLSGPVFSTDQIKKIEETRKSINAWQTK